MPDTTPPVPGLRDTLAAWLRDHALADPEDEAAIDSLIAILQGLYVPPPPGSDRDALPPHLRALIAPHMPRYESTACQTERACRAAAREHPEHAEELLAWADREHLACRRTRKQDMAECGAACHGTGRPVVPAVTQP